MAGAKPAGIDDRFVGESESVRFMPSDPVPSTGRPRSSDIGVNVVIGDRLVYGRDRASASPNSVVVVAAVAVGVGVVAAAIFM